MNKELDSRSELFFPYYINQGRLLDLYAILNDGYSEYSEVITAISSEKAKTGKIEVSGNTGFKIFNFGSNVEGSKSSTGASRDEKKTRKVQTVTSVLSIVKRKLEEKNYICEIGEAKSGSFICVPVVLSINSIKSLLNEISEMITLMNTMQKAGISIGLTKKDNDNWNAINKALQSMFAGEEILCEKDDYALTGTIVDANLYQAVREDIIGTEMTCLAQVKRIFPYGTELMKNNIFTKIKDKEAKEELINSVYQLTENVAFDFNSIAVPSIHDKPVYQVEIIALYQ